MNSDDFQRGETPVVGILMLETTFPRIPGDIGHPASFAFPVRYKPVAGASPRRVVLAPDPGLVEAFIAAGQALVAQGVKALATSCGFLALYHRQLAEALPVPVFTSSLLQVHLARALIRRDQKVAVLTASKPALTPAHLAGVGLDDDQLVIVGMEAAPEFGAVFLGGKETLDEALCRSEMAAAARALMRSHPDVGAIVLECTNMPPYTATVRRVTGLPVFDAVSLVNCAHQAVAPAQRFSAGGDRGA
jgi:hypothetical protein